MSNAQKGASLALFAALSVLGGVVGQVVNAVWKTDDHVAQVARHTAEQVGADAARRVIKDEIGPAVGAAVAAAVKPISDELIRHVASDDERQKRTDDEVQRLRQDGPALAHRGGR